MLKKLKLVLIFFLILNFNSSSFADNQDEEKTKKGLILTKITKYRDFPETCVYNIIMNYSKDRPFGDKHGRSTNAHETVHGINSYIRNKYVEILKDYNINGFYAGNGYGIILKNPKLKLRQVQNYVPHSLRGYRYKLYFEEQLGDWDDVPTYHIDEWSAYIAGAECAVDDAKHKIGTIEKADSVSGALEFSIYCVALAICVKDLDNKYWCETKQFKETIRFYLIKAERVFFAGKDIFPSEKQDILLENLKNKKDAEKIRQFLKEEFDGIFIPSLETNYIE